MADKINQIYKSMEDIKTMYANSLKSPSVYNNVKCFLEIESDDFLDHGEEPETDEFLNKLSFAKDYFLNEQIMEGRDEILKAKSMIQRVDYREKVDPSIRDSIVQEILKVSGLVSKLKP